MNTQNPDYTNVGKTTMLRNTLVLPLALAIAACSSSTDYNFENSVSEASALVAPTATFDPSNGSPFPSSLLFVPPPGVAPDGTLNLPVANPADLSNPSVALNAMDGFSTTEAITTGFSQPLDGSSLIIGGSVRVFEVVADPANPLAIGATGRELDGSEVVATPAGDGTTLAIVPRRPLKESTDYMVVLNNEIRDIRDNPMGRSTTFSLLADAENGFTNEQFEGIRLATLNMLQVVAQQAAIDPDTVTMIWSFRTQSTTPVLQAVKDNSNASTLNVQAVPGETSPGGLADILVGTLDVPYYLTASTANDPSAALRGFWTTAQGANVTRVTPMPEVKSTETIPVLMTLPNATATAATGVTQPPGGWPIAIFQHGITRNRLDMLAVADRFAAAGFAVIAIDLPLHGIVDPTIPLYVQGLERSFDLDLQPFDEQGNPMPDGVIDDSGEYFYNLRNLLNSRDNLRQGIADLWVLSASVGNLAGIDGNRKAFVGHSLGGIVGSTMLAFDNTFKSATLASPGGGVARLLAASPRFGGDIADGLMAGGVDINSARGQQFLNATQTLLDSADPINHAARTAANAPIHLTQMLDDQVVLGTVPGALLSGTVPLAESMPLPIVNQSSSGDSWVQFIPGTHGAILDPNDPANAELQTQMVTFAATQGDSMPVGDASLLQAPPEAP